MPATDNKYAPTTWGQSAEELKVPSGQRCLARRPDTAALAKDGLLHKLDSLTATVHNKHVSRKAKGGKNSAKSQQMTEDIALAQLAKDPDKLAELLDAVDKIVILTVIEPPLQLPPDNWHDREDGVVYVDTIDLEDKMYLTNFAVGGTRDVAKFRGEFNERVERLADVENVEESTERNSAD